jgi:hypothetical protein
VLKVQAVSLIPALPGDRADNHKRALGAAKERAVKERAYFEDAKNRAEFTATRQRNDTDSKYCWKS